MAMTLKANICGIARIVRTAATGAGEKHIGMAFVLDSRHVMTCCHVVNDALDRKDRLDSAPPPLDIRFALRFPFPDNARGIGKVVKWGLGLPWPVDVAVLELEHFAPPTAGVATFSGDEVRGEKWSCIGWDEAGVDREAHGELATELSSGQLQLNSPAGIAVKIGGGYSGAPLWCERLKSFVGMVVTRDREHIENGLAYAIPLRVLLGFWPQMCVMSHASGRTVLHRRRGLLIAVVSAAILLLLGLAAIKILRLDVFKPQELREPVPSAFSPLPRTRMRVGMWKWIGYSPLKVAESMDVNDGLQLEIVNVDDIKDARIKLWKNVIDASVCIVDAHVETRAEGGKSRVVLKLDASLGADAVVAREGITTFADLKGQRVAYADRDAPHYLFLALCNIHQLSPTDLTFISADAESAAEMFTKGEVDAAVTYEPYLQDALKKGHVISDSASPGVAGTIVDVLHVDEEFLLENRSVVIALIKRWIVAVQKLKNHDAGSTKIACDWLGKTTREYDMMAAGMKYSDLNENREFFRVSNDKSKFRDLMGTAQHRLRAFGVLSSEVEVDPKDADASAILFDIKP